MKVSVIIPVYNMEKYLCECLDSVLRQTLQAIEVICINDGSTDESLSMLQEYRIKDERVRIIDQENQGVAVARNNGIMAARSEFIYFLDPDDYLPDEDVLNDLYLAAVEQQVMICGGSMSEDRDGVITTDFPYPYDGYVFQVEGKQKYSEYQFDFGYTRFIYNREMIINNGVYFPVYKRFQDPPFFVKAMITAGDFYALKRITYCYRYGYKKVVWTEDKLVDAVSALLDIYRMAKEKNLEKLIKLTSRRYHWDFLYPISKTINSKCKRLIELIIKIEKEGFDSGDEEINSLVAKTFQETLLRYDAEISDRIRWQDESTELLQVEQKKNLELYENIDRLTNSLNSKSEEYENKCNELSVIVNSRSYRLYCKIMNLIPKKLLKRIRR